MDFFNQIGDTVLNAGQTAGQKVQDVAETSKLSFRIRELETKLKDKYAEVGKAMFEADEAGEELPDKTAVYDEIREIRDEIQENREQIKMIKGIDICPFCGAELTKGSVFCNKCGERLN